MLFRNPPLVCIIVGLSVLTNINYLENLHNEIIEGTEVKRFPHCKKIVYHSTSRVEVN